MPRATRPSPGYTLLEMVTLLALLAAAGVPALGGARRLMDRLAVEGAREEVAGLLARARSEGILRGGAVVRIVEDPARALLTVPSDGEDGAPGPALRILVRRDLASEYGVALETGGAGGRVELRFDELGLGSMTSRTLRFRRDRSEVRLIVSSYGRVRRP